MSRTPILLTLAILVFLSSGSLPALAQSVDTGSPALGRWDLTVHAPEGDYPAWLEIEKSGVSTLVGRYVGQAGSARPVAEIVPSMDGTYYHFSIPPQWSERRSNLDVEFRLADGKMEGWTTEHEGQVLEFTGVRAPALRREETPRWGAPVTLLEEGGLGGWHVVGGESQWAVEEGVLKKPGERRQPGHRPCLRRFQAARRVQVPGRQ